MSLMDDCDVACPSANQIERDTSAYVSHCWLVMFSTYAV